jgi:cytochrome c-type biogenesis protein CcmH/NrfG
VTHLRLAVLVVLALLAVPRLEGQRVRLLVPLDQLERRAIADSNDAPAQATLRQAQAANPRNVRALYVLGFVASQVGSSDEARDAYTQFMALAPSRFSAQKAEAEKRLQALK